MQFLPHLPLQVSVVSLLGLTLILGSIGGELARRCYFFPALFGYMAVGFISGPGLLNIATPALFAGARVFIDISLGLILFVLGRHLDLRWIYYDRGILYTSIFASFFSFIFIFAFFWVSQFGWLYAALAGTLAVATSPAVVLAVAYDLKANGPSARRILILTSLNNLYALLLLTILLPFAKSGINSDAIQEILYRIGGSFVVSAVVFALLLGIASFVGKRKENQLILFVGGIMFAIGLATLFKLPSMLTLFLLGVFARNLNFRYLLMEINFSWLEKLLIILLFVITGMHLKLTGLWETGWLVLAFIILRTLGQSLGVYLFARTSELTGQQTQSICFALTPMAGLAIGMSNAIIRANPVVGAPLMTMITAVLVVLIILGPMAVQFALVKSDEIGTDNARI